MDTLTQGTEIFNHGDRANASHFGTVSEIKTDRWGIRYLITPEADADRSPYWISASTISSAYQGNGLTRIVTKAAYLEFRNDQSQAMKGGDR